MKAAIISVIESMRNNPDKYSSLISNYNDNFYPFPQYVYSIEFYLLDAIAICKAAPVIADQNLIRNIENGNSWNSQYIQKDGAIAGSYMGKRGDGGRGQRIDFKAKQHFRFHDIN